MRFTLERGRWYAAELMGAFFEERIRSYSPIKVLSIDPRRDGRRTFELGFYHANYPEGVRDKRYTLRTLERNDWFLLAKSLDHDPTRLLLIHEITAPWLTVHFGVPLEDITDPASWLDRHA